jgi:pimeloyl-ACP methyl ester carboxylesterase
MRKRPNWPDRVAGIDIQQIPIRCNHARKLRTPTLLLTGSKTASPQLRQAIKSLMDIRPNRRKSVFEGQEHNAMDTIPQQFANTVQSFC